MEKSNKKSLNTAMEAARHLSIKFPENTYCVMDKNRSRAKCRGGQYVDELKLVGWHVHCKYQNGEMIWRR